MGSIWSSLWRVVRLLVERDDVNINARDVFGRTTLLAAAEKGHGAVVQLLTERYDGNNQF